MRLALPLACLLLATSAAADTPSVAPRSTESLPSGTLVSPGHPAAIAPDMNLPIARQIARCRDRVEIAREERGLPKLDRWQASPEAPLMLYAVETQIDGCSVLLLHSTGEIRPLPEYDNKGRLMRAK